MPTVQRVERTQSTAALPGARLNAAENADSAGVNLLEAKGRTDQALAGFGGEVAHAGNVMARDQREAADREKERADQVAVLNASNVLSEWENKRLYDPNAGALAVKGKDAFGLPEKVGDEYQEVAGQVEQTLSTDRQRQAFARVKLDRQQNIDLTLRRHVFGEMQRYEGQELTAFVENARSSAIQNANDPARVGLELGQAVDAIRTHASRLGMGPEEVQHQVEAATSNTFTGVIEQLLATDQTKAAAAYFDETKSQIKGESLARIEHALEEGKLRGQAQKKSDEIIGAGGTLTEQREKAKGIDDPKLRDEVEQRIEHNATVNDRAQREQEQETLRGVYNIIDRTHDVTAIPATVWANMDGEKRASARAYAHALAKGVPVETDFPTYYGLMQQAAHDPETFATTNLLGYRAKIGETELKQLTEMQGAIVKGDRASAEKVLGGFRSKEQLIDDGLNLYGIDPKEAGKGSTEGRAISQLRRMVDDRVQAQENLTGKKATNADMQSIVDSLLSQKASVPGSWFGTWWPTEKKLIDVTIGDVPAADKAQITEALKRANRPVSDATVLDLYLERKARGLK